MNKSITHLDSPIINKNIAVQINKENGQNGNLIKYYQ